MAVCNLPVFGSSGGLVVSVGGSGTVLSGVFVLCSAVFARAPDSGSTMS